MGLITLDSNVVDVDRGDLQAFQMYSALLIAHEFAHYWFGNLVTPKAWNEIWLNEGFAEFVQYSVCKELFPTWPFDEYFFIEEQLPAMASDDTSFAHSIVLPVGKTAFDDISYCKSAVVLQMLSKLAGAHFWTSIKSYLADNLYKPVKSGSLLMYYDKSTQDAMYGGFI